MKTLSYSVTSLAAVLALAGSTSAFAGQQQVTPSQTQFYPHAGDTVEFSLDYRADSLKLAGLGISLYFDGKALEFVGFQSCLATGRIGQDTVAAEDKADADKNPQTTQLATVAWASLSSNWPGADTLLPLTLCTAQFKVKEGFSGETQIDLKGEAAAGEMFVGGVVKALVP